jgi:hypothetical protein
MQFVARMFSEGGIWMYLVTLFALLHAVPVIAQMALCRKVDFSAYLSGGLAAIVLVGWLGTIVGAIQMFGVISQAAPEQKSSLLAMGASIAVYPTILAFMLVVPGLFFSGIAATLARNLAPRRRAAQEV